MKLHPLSLAVLAIFVAGTIAGCSDSSGNNIAVQTGLSAADQGAADAVVVDTGIGEEPVESALATRELSPRDAKSCVPTVNHVVINELLIDPVAIGDSNGEWIELYNPTASPVDLSGWYIAEDGPGIHQIVGTLVIPSDGYAVLCRNSDIQLNGGVTCAYQLTNFALVNGGDSVLLLDPSATEIDRVVYGPADGFTTSAPPAASIGLRHPYLENADLVFPEVPADPTAWEDSDFTVSTTVFGSGDKGTPGARNDGYQEQNHPTCYDGNVCTWDACTGGVCTNPRQPDCCLVNADCNDSEVCTQDLCNLNTLKCTNNEIPNCCHDLSECDDENPCNADFCTNNRCVYSAYHVVPLCCWAPDTINPKTGLPWASEVERAAFANSQCDDKKFCTPDFCDLQNNLCDAGDPIDNCCNLNSDCNDGNSCTYDLCWGHQCTHELMQADCCVTADDCDDDDPCTTDTCFGNSCRHSWASADCCYDHQYCIDFADDGNPCTSERCMLEPVSGRFTCQHPYDSSCKLSLPYVEPFDGIATLSEIGWTTRDFQSASTTHWKLNTTDGELGPDTHLAFTWDPLPTIVVKTVAVTPQLDGMTAARDVYNERLKKTTLQWRMSYRHSAPGQYIKLKVVASDNNDFINGAVVWEDMVNRDIEYTLKSVELPDAIKFSPTLKIGFLLDTAPGSTYMMNAWEIDDVKVAAGVSNEFIKAKAYRCVQNGTTPCTTTTAQLIAESEVEGEMPALTVASCDWTRIFMCYYDRDASNMTWQAYGYPLSFLDAEPLDQPAFTGGAPDIGQGGFCDTLPGVVQQVCNVPAINIDGYYYCGIDVKPNCNEDYSGSYRLGLVSQDEYDTDGNATLHAPFESLTKFDLTILLEDGYIVWSPNGMTDPSAVAIKDAIKASGRRAQIITDLSMVPDLTKYSGVFAVLGVKGRYQPLNPMNAARLRLYQDGGGKLYLEGGDFFYTVNGAQPPTVLHPYFKTEATSDGGTMRMAGPVTGSNFLHGASFTVAQVASVNTWIDKLQHVSEGGGREIVRNANVNDPFAVAVSYEEKVGVDELGVDVIRRTIGSSLPFGALVYDGAMSTNQLMTMYLNFLENGYPACTVVENCQDYEVCTTDYCNVGQCANLPVTNCIPCENDKYRPDGTLSCALNQACDKSVGYCVDIPGFRFDADCQMDFGAAPVMASCALNVGANGAVTNSNFKVGMTHDYRGDVKLTVISPSGTSAIMKNSSFADSKQDVYATWDIGVPSFQPMTVFDGEGSVGTWTVIAEDTDPSYSDGKFEEWHFFAELADVTCSIDADCPSSMCLVGTCPAGVCVFTPKGCDDGLSCTVDSCDPNTGACINEVIQACGGPCVTHDDCFRNEVCLVAGTEDRVCDPTVDIDPITGESTCVCRSIEGQPYEYDWVNDLPSAIPDADPLGLTKVLQVNATGFVSKVKVKVRTIHQAAGDLRAELCHEDVCVRLRDAKGGINPGFHDAYDWDPVVGPGQMLDFRRLPVAGDWTLKVWDNVTGMTGELVYFTIYVVSAGCFRNSECDDGNLCTLDSCSNVSTGGVCVHALKQCEPTGDACTTNVCQPDTGECLAAPAEDGDPCDDGLYCTEDDFCQAGNCHAGDQMDCGFLGGTCTLGVCSEDLDQCTIVQAPDETACEDGELCNGGDYCESGVCIPGPTLLCGCPNGLDSSCLDDGNKCNGRTWVCNDDKMCELADGPVVCSAPDVECRSNVCDPFDGVCKLRNSLNYTPCEDGLFCSVQDFCLVAEDSLSYCTAGTARDCSVADIDCGDGYCASCVDGYCDESADACAETNKDNGTSCEFDGLGCSNDVCNNGMCGFGTMVDCSDTGDDCNEGLCQNVGWGDFLCVRGSFPDGTVCTDEPNPCTEDLCMDGYCEHARMNNCNGPCGGEHPFDAGDDDCGFEDSCVGGIEGYPLGGCNPTCPDGACYKATSGTVDLPINERVNGNGCTNVMVPVTTGFAYVLNAEMKMKISHEAIGQLQIDLIDPQGARHRVWHNLGEENHGFANTFDLSFPITYPGIPTSGQPMCALAGEAMDGIWTVQVCDRADGASGTLHDFSLYMKGSDDPTLNLGSRCETPIDLGNQDQNPAIFVDGTLQCAINSINDSGCGGMEGPDRIYKFNLATAKRVTVKLLPVPGNRLILFLKGADGATCAAGSMRCAETTDTEAAIVDVQLQPGDYYVGVDTNSGLFAYTPFRFELRIKTLVENGGDCTDLVLGEQDLDCASLHCQNGFCCDSGDCCPAEAWTVPEDGEDPNMLWFDPEWMTTDTVCNRVQEGLYSEDPICNDPDLADPSNPINYCQGKRWDARCVAYQCVKAEVPDDTACDDTVESDHCGFYYSMYCGDYGPFDSSLVPQVQSKPDCLTYCTSNTDCDPNAHCDPVVATDPDPDPSMRAMYCVADLPNGAESNEDSDCISGHSQNGFCCSEGDCCPTDDEAGALECPGIYTTPGSCDTTSDPITGELVCEGHRKDPICVDNKCGTQLVRDDCRCGGAIADNCGAYIPALCPVSAYSDPELCPGAGWLAPWDGGGTVCLDSCLTPPVTGVPDDSKCDDDARCDWDDDNPTNAICIPLVPNGGPCEENIDCLNQQWIPGGEGHCQNGFCCDFGDCCNRNTDCPVVDPRGDYWAPPVCDNYATCQGTEVLATCLESQCGSETTPEDSACVYDLGQISDDCGYYLPVFCNGDVEQIDPPCPTTCYDAPTTVELDAVCDPNAHCDPVPPTYSNAVCLADLANDQPCDEDSDCISQFCQSGYCCDVGGCCAGCKVTSATPSFSNAGYEGTMSTEYGFVQFAPTVPAVDRPATGGRTVGAELGTFEGVTVVTTCWNLVQDQAETDVDCGGRVCNKCIAGKHCVYGTDCASGTCIAGVCQ